MRRERVSAAPRPFRQRVDRGRPVLVLDTETTIDPSQALLFGCWRYYRPSPLLGWVLADEGLFYADELPDEDPGGLTVLRQYAATATTSASTGRLRLMSRDEFISQVFYSTAWDNRATVVGFNLPFDIARIAIDATEGRGGNLRGFSFPLARGNESKGYREQKHKPRITVKHLNSHAAFISFSSAFQARHRWAGEFVDCRTLLFALTSQGHSLDSGCRAMGLGGKADPGAHGIITERYIDYCRTDVERTGQLYQICVRQLDALDLPISPAKAYSPASLSKAVLRTLGVTPHSQRPNPLPPEVLGRFMSAFYGGRAECRIRRTEVPVALVDFTSMYPTLFALMNLWQYCIAEQIDTIDATDDVQAMLQDLAVDDLFDANTWPRLVGVALVEPAADVLPVRAPYNEHKDALNIGINYLTSATPLWYTLADVAASTLLTGRPPRIVRAVRLTHRNVLAGLNPWKMPGGRLLDPGVEAPWPAMIEHRQRTRRDRQLPAEERDRINLFLKIMANAGGYGIYAEYNRQDQPTGAQTTVDVYCHGDPFSTTVTSPEEPGTYSCPPLAAVITGGARLMLALLERCVTDLGGAWAFADTDSMAIVAGSVGGLVPCSGGQEIDDAGRPCVRALSTQEVEEIRARFTALNPYDTDAVPGSILKRELDAYCYAIAAKRYALYRYDGDGHPRLVPTDEHQPCSHGLGHLLNPVDVDSREQDWIVGWWQDYLAKQLCGVRAASRDWMSLPALGKVAITTPATWKALHIYNQRRRYRNQIKPFGFLLHAPGAGQGDQSGRLVSPFTRDPSRWLKMPWIALGASEITVRIGTDPTMPQRVNVATYRALAQAYFTHRESKAQAWDGIPCSRFSAGLLGRRHVVACAWSVIGKEANDLAQRASGFKGAGATYQPQSYRGKSHGLGDAALGRLREFGAAELARRTGLSARRLRDVLDGGAVPRATTAGLLLEVLGSDLAGSASTQTGGRRPSE